MLWDERPVAAAEVGGGELESVEQFAGALVGHASGGQFCDYARQGDLHGCGVSDRGQFQIRGWDLCLDACGKAGRWRSEFAAAFELAVVLVAEVGCGKGERPAVESIGLDVAAVAIGRCIS